MDNPESIRNSELSHPPELLERALSAAAEGITIADARLPDRPLIYCNEGFERLTGYSRAETLGRNCRFLQGRDTDSTVVDTIRQSVAEKRESVVEILNYRKDGTPFWNRLSITPIFDDDGLVTHFIGVQSDVTERREAEEALRKTNDRLEQVNKEVSRDLEFAARVQQNLLPQSRTSIPGVKVGWALNSCDELAGDTLGILRLSDSQLGVFVADVSGHGVAAALLSVSVTHWFDQRLGVNLTEAQANALASSAPTAIAEDLNRQFPIDLDTGQYFTLVYGVVDTGTREFRYVCAGHPSPVHVTHTGNATCPTLTGFPIGISPQPAYNENVIRLDKGDRIVLYSDGIIEAENPREVSFGIERVLNNLSTKPAPTLEDTVNGLLKEVTDWTAPRGHADDITVLAIELE
jgi:PAS domain S-box-containing protein